MRKPTKTSLCFSWIFSNPFKMFMNFLHKVIVAFLNFHQSFDNLLSHFISMSLKKKASQKDLIRFLTLIFIFTGVVVYLYLIYLFDFALKSLNTLFVNFNLNKKNTCLRSKVTKFKIMNILNSVVFNLAKTNKLNVYPKN